MSFSGGSRACVGYRYSLVESVFLYYAPSTCWVCFRQMKAPLSVLIRAFGFELTILAKMIMKSSGTVVQQPLIRVETAKGAQMPMLIMPYVSSPKKQA